MIAVQGEAGSQVGIDNSLGCAAVRSSGWRPCHVEASQPHLLPCGSCSERHERACIMSSVRADVNKWLNKQAQERELEQ